MVEERSAGFVVFRKQAVHCRRQACRGGAADRERLYLLLMHGDGRWDFPKGNIERGETSREASLRELKEETGIKCVRQIQGWDHRISYFYRKGSQSGRGGGRLVHKEVVFYLGEASDDKVTISNEHKGSGWFGYEEAMAKLKFENARLTLEKAETFIRMNPGK